MNYSIRKIRDDEYALLNDFLYEAIFILEGEQTPPKSIINQPELQQRGYEKASLSVQKANYTVRMYKSLGFEIIDENKQEYIMVYYLW